jgi:hypothetical protein
VPLRAIGPSCPLQTILLKDLVGCYSPLQILMAIWHTFLKVPKREIFDRSDFPDVYTIKSLCVGDFGVKITNFLNNN